MREICHVSCNAFYCSYYRHSYLFLKGTNPIAIGVPTTPRVQVLDMATSASAWYIIFTTYSLLSPINTNFYDIVFFYRRLLLSIQCIDLLLLRKFIFCSYIRYGLVTAAEEGQAIPGT